MSKMNYFSNKFSKIANRWVLSAPSAYFSSILVIWSCVIWPNVFFLNWLWQNWTSKNQFWRHFS